MNCKKCGSENVTTQIVSKTIATKSRHGCLWWLLVGWWWWLFFTLFALIIAIATSGRKDYHQKNTVTHVCQDCGFAWEDNTPIASSKSKIVKNSTNVTNTMPAKFCSNCGSKTNGGKFCTNCGSAIKK